MSEYADVSLPRISSIASEVDMYILEIKASDIYVGRLLLLSPQATRIKWKLRSLGVGEAKNGIATSTDLIAEVDMAFLSFRPYFLPLLDQNRPFLSFLLP